MRKKLLFAIIAGILMVGTITVTSYVCFAQGIDIDPEESDGSSEDPGYGGGGCLRESCIHDYTMGGNTLHYTCLRCQEMYCTGKIDKKCWPI